MTMQGAWKCIATLQSLHIRILTYTNANTKYKKKFKKIQTKEMNTNTITNRKVVTVTTPKISNIEMSNKK